LVKRLYWQWHSVIYWNMSSFLKIESIYRGDSDKKQLNQVARDIKIKMHYLFSESVFNLCLSLLLEFILVDFCKSLLCFLLATYMINVFIWDEKRIDSRYLILSMLLISVKMMPIPNNGFWMRLAIGQFALCFGVLHKYFSDLHHALVLDKVLDLLNQWEYHRAKSSGCPGH